MAHYVKEPSFVKHMIVGKKKKKKKKERLSYYFPSSFIIGFKSFLLQFMCNKAIKHIYSHSYSKKLEK